MRYGFNLKYENYIKDIESNDVYQYNLLKNKALISGDGNIVRYFYQNVASNITSGNLAKYIMQEVQQSFFYRAKPSNAFVFYGITKMINRGIVRLVTNGSFKIIGEYEDRLTGLLLKNQFNKKYREGVKLKSGVGDFLYRIANDPQLANYPIIEVIEAEKFELIIERGIITGYILKARMQIDKDWYELQEIYSKVNNQVQIEYKVYDGQGQSVDLKQDSIRAKKIIEMFGLKELRQLSTFPIQPLNVKHIPIVYVSNAEHNKGLRGIADTDGMESLEAALSETLSDLIDEIRKAGLKILIDQSLQPQNERGEPQEFDHFDKDIIVTKSEGQEGKNLIQTAQGILHSDKFIETSKYLIAIACNKAEIHPISVGITGLESIAASAESQQEREGKTSLRKRENELAEWSHDFKELGVRVLEMDDLLNGRLVSDYFPEKIGIEFGKYTNPNPEAVISIIQKRIETGIESMKEAIKQDRPDLEEEKVDIIYAQVKVEKGLPLTPHEMELLGLQPQVQIVTNTGDEE